MHIIWLFRLDVSTGTVTDVAVETACCKAPQCDSCKILRADLARLVTECMLQHSRNR